MTYSTNAVNPITLAEQSGLVQNSVGHNHRMTFTKWKTFFVYMEIADSEVFVSMLETKEFAGDGAG